MWYLPKDLLEHWMPELLTGNIKGAADHTCKVYIEAIDRYATKFIIAGSVT